MSRYWTKLECQKPSEDDLQQWTVSDSDSLLPCLQVHMKCLGGSATMLTLQF